MFRRARTVASAAALLAASVAASPADARVLAVPSGQFASPTYLTHAPGRSAVVFVTERAGRVKVAGASGSRTFLDISGRVSTAGEGGLLSVAFAPDYATSGLFYVAYANTAGDLEVDEARRSAASADQADPASRRQVLVIGHREYGNHYGGQLNFGPDGRLYLGTGDGGGAGDPLGNAQDLTDLRGKLLRFDPRVSPVAPEIYAYGLRNPWRWSFDRSTGAIAIGDVGQNTREEVDYLPAGTAAGTNFGWNVWEGTFRYSPGELTNHTPPVLERPRNAGACTSITGGYVVRGPSLPSLAGRYVYGDFCTGDLRSAQLALPRATGDAALGVNVPALVSFGEDSGGCLYALSLGGQVYRLTEDRLGALTAPCALRVV